METKSKAKGCLAVGCSGIAGFLLGIATTVVGIVVLIVMYGGPLINQAQVLVQGYKGQ